MVRGEDTHDTLLRRMHEHQAALIERVSRGNVPALDGTSGYWALAAQVRAWDDAIVMVREILFGERPQESEKPFDPLGVR